MPEDAKLKDKIGTRTTPDEVRSLSGICGASYILIPLSQCQRNGTLLVCLSSDMIFCGSTRTSLTGF